MSPRMLPCEVFLAFLNVGKYKFHLVSCDALGMAPSLDVRHGEDFFCIIAGGGD